MEYLEILEAWRAVEGRGDCMRLVIIDSTAVVTVISGDGGCTATGRSTDL